MMNNVYIFCCAGQPGMHTYTYYGDGSLQYEKNADGTTTLKSYTYTPDGLLHTATFDGKTLTDANFGII